MIVILGAGLSGLAAGHRLVQSGREIVVVEKSTAVGGLSRTVVVNNHRFDLGGHRFLTDDAGIETLVRDLLGKDLLTVPRRSRIHLRGQYVDYPLRPANALFGLGVPTALKALYDYFKEKMIDVVKDREIVTLRDWVVSQFGRTMYDLYFKEYSEKVWGMDCHRIDRAWIAQRIDGLSLWQALKNAFSKVSGKNIKTLTDTFYYPRWGIGQLSDRLRDEISRFSPVLTETEVTRVYHDNGSVHTVSCKGAHEQNELEGDVFVSSIPITLLLRRLSPAPPEHVLTAASKIRYRGLVTVTLMFNQERVTDLTWLYLPDKAVPFGRIHEPRNWSPFMAPPGRTHLVAEYFCSEGDSIWNGSDRFLTELTAHHLHRLGLIDRDDVADSCVLRIPDAYPVFEVGYRDHVKTLTDYLDGFENLHIIGRSGMFRYLNMDRAMESGILTAEEILHRRESSLPIRAPMEAVSNPL